MLLSVGIEPTQTGGKPVVLPLDDKSELRVSSARVGATEGVDVLHAGF